ncbi:MAG TPA: PQQ-binding-like beta-propeller repeat protein [Candidatus Eremiobacteraeota bacterium]|nr:MAG: Serine/threonine-protein kinase B [bacterium ADurb.Bin363]HPZ09421.1 PQQ-binding-like beta-propeller repeat protein [Candidatus Eremiobacteraeota bacterium]
MTRFCHSCGRENRDTSKFCSGCGNILEGSSYSSVILPSGTVLENRYVIVNLIKKSLRGGVYKCLDKKLDSFSAIKEILPPYGTPEELVKAREKFEQEVRLIAKLNHSNLVKVLDYFINRGRYYVVMNFIDGEDLLGRLKKEGKPGFPEEKVVAWSRQVLEVLDYLHNHRPPVIYCDIKPENIIIQKDAQPVLIHYAISRLIYHRSRLTQKSGGISAYIPEEQIRGDPEVRSDLYALGATMHHLLTGIEPLPFRFEPLRKMALSVSSTVENVIMKALENNPSDRFSSAKKMLDALPYKPKILLLSRSENKEKKLCENSREDRIIWEFETGGSVRSSPCVSEGRVYFGSWDSKFYCLNAKNGKKIWDFRTGWHIYSSPCVSEGRVYFGSCDKKFYCLDGEKGLEIWHFETDCHVYSSPFVLDGLVYFGSSDKKFYCLDARTGKKIWAFATGGGVYSNPRVSEGRVYFGSSDKKLYSLDAKIGKKIWEFQTYSEVGSCPCILEGRVYFGSLDKRLYCLDVENGIKLWNFKTGLGIYSSPYILNDFIYFGSLDKRLYCLDIKDGKKIWDFETGGMIYSSPCINDEMVYFGSWYKNFFCLDATTGKKIWDFDTNLGVYSSPCVSEGRVYFGDENNKFYCLDASKEGRLNILSKAS